jgi:hypothetical protein
MRSSPPYLSFAALKTPDEASGQQLKLGFRRGPLRFGLARH